MKTGWLLLCLCAVSLTAQAGPRLSRKRLEAHVHHLASKELAGRATDKPGGILARNYIIAEFKKYGLKPGNKGSWLQKLTTLGRGANVLGILPGSDPKLAKQVVIIGAHYDHLGVRDGKMFRGANDNAAGVSVVLELARVMATRKQAPARSILFACWDAEEGGLHGSRQYIRTPTVPLKDIVAVLDMDLIGRDFLDILPRKVFVIGSESATGLRKIVDAAAKGRKLDVLALGADLVGPRCDFWNFRRKKVPHLFFSCAEHDDYHQTTDLPERIRYDKLAEIGRMIGATLTRLSGSGKRPLRPKRVVHSTDEAATMARVIAEVIAVTKMGLLERLVWQRAHARLLRIAAKKRFSFVDRNILRAVVAATLIRRRFKRFELKVEKPK